VYFERFLAQWEFIRNHTIDGQNHGLFNLTTAEGKPLTEDKGSIWKAAYHDGRAFWNVSERLRKLSSTCGTCGAANSASAHPVTD
jgi:cellobiose epimerase